MLQSLVCSHPLFKCQDESKCLRRDQLCDGTKDCLDGSDETEFAGCKPGGGTGPIQFPPGVIVGMVICGLLLVAVVLLAVICLVVRRKNQAGAKHTKSIINKRENSRRDINKRANDSKEADDKNQAKENETQPPTTIVSQSSENIHQSYRILTGTPVRAYQDEIKKSPPLAPKINKSPQANGTLTKPPPRREDELHSHAFQHHKGVDMSKVTNKSFLKQMEAQKQNTIPAAINRHPIQNYETPHVYNNPAFENSGQFSDSNLAVNPELVSQSAVKPEDYPHLYNNPGYDCPGHHSDTNLAARPEMMNQSAVKPADYPNLYNNPGYDCSGHHSDNNLAARPEKMSQSPARRLPYFHRSLDNMTALGGSAELSANVVRPTPSVPSINDVGMAPSWSASDQFKPDHPSLSLSGLGVVEPLPNAGIPGEQSAFRSIHRASSAPYLLDSTDYDVYDDNMPNHRRNINQPNPMSRTRGITFEFGKNQFGGEMNI